MGKFPHFLPFSMGKRKMQAPQFTFPDAPEQKLRELHFGYVPWC